MKKDNFLRNVDVLIFIIGKNCCVIEYYKINI